ncbi:NADP-dependent aryl-alcohol dehydrogenase [Rhizobium wenxiniae]|uniref:Aryl-alcohol dehydrogenase-like predicted oxidoreductase n=1 Tax=Rhizobium wenxiniae TaxID=1737357 RepID=A0A7W9Y6U9_9HYPH|nr:aldo/keto reductase [Rhizobium wenxiniae]MBB6163055.1 aryl-alcohol dehydrogenase-like predicted oxidoreductase [Rhizobium wenxiniae]GGF93733.1 NADP-dependent aryl-alcohol dehydrogenase [Rhizobium wenxiniae]
MDLRVLGRTGLSISPVVFGGNVFGWTADEKTSFDLLDKFFDAGFDTIDTADCYSGWVPGNAGGESETIIGKWLKQSGRARDKAVIITKVGSTPQGSAMEKGLTGARIIDAVESSLKRLQTDYIDLYLSHWPDPQTPHEETLAAFAKLKQQGKIRAIGCSNFNAEQLKASFEAAEKAGLPRYDVLEPEYNLYDRSGFDGPLADLCNAQDVGVITYFSLASGFLTGKYKSKAEAEANPNRGGMVAKYFDERGTRILAALDEVAAETHSQPASVALAWIAQRPGVTAPIASATSARQLDTLIAAGNLKLTSNQMALLNDASA